jgi:hypothetical protein
MCVKLRSYGPNCAQGKKKDNGRNTNTHNENKEETVKERVVCSLYSELGITGQRAVLCVYIYIHKATGISSIRLRLKMGLEM